MDLKELEAEIKSLKQKVQVLEDTEEIQKLQLRYVNALTQVKWDEVIDCFTEDAVVDLVSGYAKGKADFSKLFREKISLMHIGLEGNFAVHPIITVDGDKAKGSWLMYIQLVKNRPLPANFSVIFGGEPADWMQGYYEMEYARAGGMWKISALKWRRRISSPRPKQ